jgi:K+-sensing histidine kinase KdpD
VAFVVIRQPLIALLVNAAIYSPPGESIGASVMLDEGAIVLVVADHGPGLEPGEPEIDLLVYA